MGKEKKVKSKYCESYKKKGKMCSNCPMREEEKKKKEKKDQKDKKKKEKKKKKD